MTYDVQLFSNNAVALLQTAISAVATSLTVQPGLGALFPSPVAGEYFLVTLEDQAATVREIIRVNSRSGDTFTSILRAQEGTTALPWTASVGFETLVDHRVTAETMRLAMLLPEVGAGSVTSIDVSGGATGLTTSGGPITSTGTITLGGTLSVAHGGTGQVTANAALNALLPTQTGNSGKVLTTDGTNTSWVTNGSGTVTSVALAVPSFLSVAGSPITTSGTLTVTLATQAAHTVLAGPVSGGPAVPTFRQLSIDELSDVDTTSIAPTNGDVLEWSGTNWVPQTPGAATAWIYGENDGPTTVPASTQLAVNAATYTNTNRTFKFLVTVLKTSTSDARAFELLVIVTGNLGTNSETVMATQYATLGALLAGFPHVTLNTSTKVLSLEWENNEASSVDVTITRIQHQPL